MQKDRQNRFICTGTNTFGAEIVLQSCHSPRQTIRVHSHSKNEEEQDTKTQKCGQFVHQHHPFVAASPDCVINPELVAEVKCPFSAKGNVISPDLVSYLYEHNGSLYITVCLVVAWS